MTKKDYKALAEAIRRSEDGINTNILSKRFLVTELCPILLADNPRFDEKRFKIACNYTL